MKVIDLLNKIANDEELPNKLKLKNYDYVFTLRADCTGYKWYGEEKTHDDFGEVIHKNLEFVLKQEIEIIEEDKPIEKIFGLHHPSTKSLDLIKEDIELAFATIDKLIDKVNELNKKESKFAINLADMVF